MKSKNIIIILILCCLLAITASIVASSHPDGLEWVAEKLNFLEAGEGKEVISAPMPNYAIPGIKNNFLSLSIAATIGTLIVFILAYLLGRIVARKKREG